MPMAIDAGRARLDQSRHHEYFEASIYALDARRANGEKTLKTSAGKDPEIKELRKIITGAVTPEKEEEIYRWYTTKREIYTKKHDAPRAATAKEQRPLSDREALAELIANKVVEKIKAALPNRGVKGGELSTWVIIAAGGVGVGLAKAVVLAKVVLARQTREVIIHTRE